MEGASQKRIIDFLGGAASRTKRRITISESTSTFTHQIEGLDESYASADDKDYDPDELTEDSDDFDDPENESEMNESEMHHREKELLGRGPYKERKCSRWDANRNFKNDWLREYPFVEPVDVEGRKMVKCTICSWKNKTDKLFQPKKNSIDRHVGKLKRKIIEDGVTKYVFAGWEGPEKNLHARNAILFYRNEELLKEKKNKATKLHCLFEKAELLEYESKCIQMRVVLHLLQHGRPMKDYPEHEILNVAHRLPNIPRCHWSENSGWEFATHMSFVALEELREVIKGSTFLALSLDEVTAKDNTSWLCMHLYNVVDFQRRSYFLSIIKLRLDATAETLYSVVQEKLNEIANMSLVDCARKLICFGTDGASVMTGCNTGLAVRLQTSFLPYMVAIHCMAHRTNLAFKIVSDFVCVQKVENLIRAVNQLYCRSPQRFAHFQQFSVGLSEGLKLLKDVETRWISIALPVRRLCSEYVSVVGACAQLTDENEAAARDLFALLTDAETLLTLYALTPLLRELTFLIKQAQDKTIYIPEYSIARKIACTKLDKLYVGDNCFDKDEAFYRWQNLVSLQEGRSFLAYNDSRTLCIHVNDKFFPLYHRKKSGRNNYKRKVEVKESEFDSLISSIRNEMNSVAESLSQELRSRFPRDELLDAMGIVFPNFWNNATSHEVLFPRFTISLGVLRNHFCARHVVEGVEINGVLDLEALKEQSGLFGTTMYAQFGLLEKPLEQGAVTRLWVKLTSHDYLKAALSEYIKLANLILTMILGSVEDERAFSSLSFIKNKLRNRLDANLDATLRLYKCDHSLESFPYDQAFQMWKQATNRRGTTAMHELQHEDPPILHDKPELSVNAWHVTNL